MAESEALPETGPLEVPGTLRPVPFEDVEDLPGFWARVGAMFQMAFTQPLEAFERVPATFGLGAPWRFLLLLSLPVFLLLALVLLIVGVGATLVLLDGHAAPGSRPFVPFLPLGVGLVILLMPLLAFLGMLLGGVLNHFFLWLWGGLRPGVGLVQTIRAYGYASAFLQVAQILVFIPFLGFLLQIAVQIAGMVFIGLGLARMHRTDPWRGVCAALTPLALAFLAGIVVLVILLPALLAAGARA